MSLSDTEARDLIARTRWYHRFEILPGIMTDGASLTNPSAGLDLLGVPSQLSGVALDIGAWDGAYTFRTRTPRRRSDSDRHPESTSPVASSVQKRDTSRRVYTIVRFRTFRSRITFSFAACSIT